MICINHAAKIVGIFSTGDTTNSTSIHKIGIKDSGTIDNGPSIHQEDAVFSSLSQQLVTFCDVLLSAYPSFHLPIVSAPIVFALPRLLSQCIMQIIQNIGAINKSLRSVKPRFLRMVVSSQQIITSLVTLSTATDYESRRKLTDSASDEIEKLRKFVSMIDIPSSELKVICFFYKISWGT